MPSLRKHGYLPNVPLTAVLLFLSTLGLLNLYSATRVAPKGMFVSQLVWFGIGAVLLLAVALLDQKTLRRLALPAYVSVLGLLLFVLLFGKVVNGSRRWLGFGSFGMQPSELAKLSLVLLGAHLFSEDTQRLVYKPWRSMLAWHALWAAPVLLILKQPDLGTALLCVLVALSLFLCHFRLGSSCGCSLWVQVGLFCCSGLAFGNINRNGCLRFFTPNWTPPEPAITHGKLCWRSVQAGGLEKAI